MARSSVFRLNGIGFGTWAWGNQLVWGYDPHRDDALPRLVLETAVAEGILLLEPAGLVLPRGPCLCLYPEQTAAFWQAHQGPGLVA